MWVYCRAVELGRLFPFDPPPPIEPTSKERIRDAALSCFADRGIAATSLRRIAETAEVSIGLVQHHFRTKATLTAAVDQYVLQVVGEALAPTALPDPPSDGLSEAGRRLTALMVERPDVMTYLGRALAEGGAFGSIIFSGLVGISAAQREHFVAQGNTQPDLDPDWAAINVVILRVGAVILHPYIELYLGKSFFSEAQLRRWDASVTGLLRHGLFLDEEQPPNGDTTG
ncbi:MULTISPECIES: TetR/AcrR family transcriptional regulator [unclassified Mycobacterium]|uniref:TetR/AcrR family transcriptional regulator n=1 Tax=unclassified Mycobacterium TaxID=2642494 RepID=UPI000802131D|nr:MULTISPECIES: TetR/AcrR family transcriptional regulator [unclassified Mycobacterium]OBH04123.1 TetR family transcriptional regulator [Mycobacterium sp. E2699]OBI57640.1 TetR family transcriptional regulator [Mycobacterium sp. E787]